MTTQLSSLTELLEGMQILIPFDIGASLSPPPPPPRPPLLNALQYIFISVGGLFISSNATVQNKSLISLSDAEFPNERAAIKISEQTILLGV